MDEVEEVLGILTEFEEFTGQHGFGDEISTEKLGNVLKIIGMNEEVEGVIERFEEKYEKIYMSLLGITLLSWKQEQETKNWRRSRLAVRILVNMVQRNQKFSEHLPSKCVDLLETILATEQFDKEILLLLVKTAKSTSVEFQKARNYTSMMNRVVDAFYRANEKFGEGEKVDSNDASSAIAYISILLETDFAFLANCYAEMTEDEFVSFLSIVDIILEHTNTEIHENNLIFIINLLELLSQEYYAYLTAMEKTRRESVEKRKKLSVEIMGMVVNMIAEMCQDERMKGQLTKDGAVITQVLDVLDTILHTEARFSEYREAMGSEYPSLPPDEPKYAEIRKLMIEDKRIVEARKKKVDRPTPPQMSKIERIESSGNLLMLSDSFLEFYKCLENENYSDIGNLKLACLRAIANLCELSMENKLATLRNGRQGLLSVLQCTTRRPLWFMESYAIQKWAIFCVRQLTDECAQNKEVILNLEQPNQPIIGRHKLLEQFGLKSVTDDGNIQRLVRIDEEEE